MRKFQKSFPRCHASTKKEEFRTAKIGVANRKSGKYSLYKYGDRTVDHREFR